MNSRVQKYKMIQMEESSAAFSLSGNLFELISSGIMVNLFRGTERENPAGGIWLRLYREKDIEVYPLTGSDSTSQIVYGADRIVFSGIAGGVSYQVAFILAQAGHWFWQVSLNGKGEIVDLLYGQDLGMAQPAAVMTNELYVAQYLGHTVFENETGYHLCSRQNMDQEGKKPTLQQGLLKGKSVGFSTDGFQFFGLSYKKTQVPEAFSRSLPNKIWQKEFAYTALQTERLQLNSPQEIVFYGRVEANCPHAIKNMTPLAKIQEVYQSIKPPKNLVNFPHTTVRAEFGQPYASPSWNMQELQERFPERRLVETDGNTLLSFFTAEHTHVVTQQKELLTERPHGMIVSTFMDMEKVNPNLMSSTHYMYGIFNAQTTVGNVNRHKLISTARGNLNNVKYAGQRLYVRIGGQYRLLTLPAVYEMGMNYSRWYYTIGEDVLVVTSFSVADKTDIVLDVRSEKGILYDFIVTIQIVMGEHEFAQSFCTEERNGGKILRILPNSSQWPPEYPDISYDIQLPQEEFEAGDDRIFFTDNQPHQEGLLTWRISDKKVQMIISGHLEKADSTILPLYDFEQERQKSQKSFAALTRGLELTIDKESPQRQEVEILNETVWWYSHNAMIHYAVPHGLEQPGGAAWGTRDICQGPMEYFLATHHFDLARAVLLEIFSHQKEKTGEWPQWFMFDRYAANAGECHGDVVFWPLKITAEYLAHSGDYTCLQEEIAYCDENGVKVKGNTLLQHLQKAVEAIERCFVGTTHLISYAGGDWDDTLQPAKEELRQKLVSSWTQALAYQSLFELGESLKTEEEKFADCLLDMAQKIKKDFNELLVIDGVVSGFVYRSGDKIFSPMLHPLDTKTGIGYRLLPMTRSIIAEMVDKKQAEQNQQIIREKLLCPDGARLMDNPPRYHGGVSELFVRAEQAAYVGREVGLMYSHAHIRYIESLTKMQDNKNAWKQLFTINPILIQNRVVNADRRQSNLYFSSSEGAYADRYDFSENFDKLLKGDIDVKGGWRLYSSGPGIYLNQLITNILGLSVKKDCLLVHPCLPEQLDGLRVRFECFGKMHTFVYHADTALAVFAEEKKFGQTIQISRYGGEGVCLKSNELELMDSVIDIHFKK